MGAGGGINTGSKGGVRLGEGVTGVQIQHRISSLADDGLLGHGAGLHMTRSNDLHAILLEVLSSGLGVSHLGGAVDGLEGTGLFAAVLHGLVFAVPLDGVVRAVGEPAAIGADHGVALSLIASRAHQ